MILHPLVFPDYSVVHWLTLKQWKGINHKQSTRWQHLSQLKASAFFSLQFFLVRYETQQLILGTGTAIWWVTEPHWPVLFSLSVSSEEQVLVTLAAGGQHQTHQQRTCREWRRGLV